MEVMDMVEAALIPKNLASRRRALGMPIDELSTRSGVSISTIKRFLAGKTLSRYDNALKIGEALGVPALDIDRARDTERMRLEQAIKKAERLVCLSQGTMALEAQAVDKATRNRVKRMMVHRLLQGPRVRLWATV